MGSIFHMNNKKPDDLQKVKARTMTVASTIELQMKKLQEEFPHYFFRVEIETQKVNRKNVFYRVKIKTMKNE